MFGFDTREVAMDLWELLELEMAEVDHSERAAKALAMALTESLAGTWRASVLPRVSQLDYLVTIERVPGAVFASTRRLKLKVTEERLAKETTDVTTFRIWINAITDAAEQVTTRRVITRTTTDLRGSSAEATLGSKPTEADIRMGMTKLARLGMNAWDPEEEERARAEAEIEAVAAQLRQEFGTRESPVQRREELDGARGSGESATDAGAADPLPRT